MQRITYYMGKITKYVSLRFSISLKSKRHNVLQSVVQMSQFNGGNYARIMGLYPSIYIDLSDEVRDESSHIYSTDRSVSMSRYTTKLFVKSAKEFLKSFEEKDLFYYDDNELSLYKDLAWKKRVVINGEFGKKIILTAAVVEDSETHHRYEGAMLAINELSNYALLTYDEFVYLVKYMEEINFDMFAMCLINTAIMLNLTKKKHVVFQAEPVEKEPTTEDLGPIETKEKPKEGNNTSWNLPKQMEVIPKI